MPATPASSSHWSMLVELARVDTRSRLATDAACAQAAALVARERERVARLRIRRAALVLVIEGSKELVRGGRSVLLTAGRAIGLPAGWTGDVVNVPNDTSGIYRALFVDFPPDLVTRALRAHPGWRRSTGAAARAPAAPSPLLVEAVAHLAVGLRSEATPRHVIEHRAMEVLLAMGDSGMLATAGKAIEGSVQDAVRELLRWRPDHPWTAEGLGHELGMSQATLRRRLALEGASLRRLVSEERMALGRVMILEEGSSVGTAAAAAGYASPSRFARRFRKVYGHNPSRTK